MFNVNIILWWKIYWLFTTTRGVSYVPFILLLISNLFCTKGKGGEGGWESPLPLPHSPLPGREFTLSRWGRGEVASGTKWIHFFPVEMSADSFIELLFEEPFNQCFGFVFIWYGSGSSILGWIPIWIRIQSGSRVLMTKNWKWGRSSYRRFCQPSGTAKH